ncbi:hypothetical protein [Rhizobium leguminosarum]|uniref:hypothetical protein n=1 Tax=Rhizobium leguminosarum TaxID=384 RepID=UPI001FE116CF|nr:hypothetical protein [Rhizobium leguminosarum]
MLTNGHRRHDQKSNGQVSKTPSQSSACPAETCPERFLGPLARWMGGDGSWRQGNYIARSPEDFENLPPLFVRKASLSAGSFETGVDVSQEGALPSNQIPTAQRCFDVVSEVPSRIHYRRLLSPKTAYAGRSEKMVNREPSGAEQRQRLGPSGLFSLSKAMAALRPHFGR